MDRRHVHAAGKFEDLGIHLHHALTVRVGDLHRVGVAIPKLKDDPPPAVDVDGPEIRKRSFEFVKSDTVQLAQVTQRCRRIEFRDPLFC
jgi:hypothetical protein